MTAALPTVVYDAHGAMWSVTVTGVVTGMVEVAQGRRNPVRTPRLTVICEGGSFEADSVDLSPDDAELFAACLVDAARAARTFRP